MSLLFKEYKSNYSISNNSNSNNSQEFIEFANIKEENKSHQKRKISSYIKKRESCDNNNNFNNDIMEEIIIKSNKHFSNRQSKFNNFANEKEENYNKINENISCYINKISTNKSKYIYKKNNFSNNERFLPKYNKQIIPNFNMNNITIDNISKNSNHNQIKSLSLYNKKITEIRKSQIVNNFIENNKDFFTNKKFDKFKQKISTEINNNIPKPIIKIKKCSKFSIFENRRTSKILNNYSFINSNNNDNEITEDNNFINEERVIY